MKTKKIITLIIITITMSFVSCVQPVLNKNEFKIMDTLYTSRNAFNTILSYDVIIKYDSSFYFGTINKKGELSTMDFHKIKVDELK